MNDIKVDPELWAEFKTHCKKRGVSTCQQIRALIKAWVE